MESVTFILNGREVTAAYEGRMTLLFSIGTAGIMYFSADMLSEAFYSDNEAGFYIRVLSPLIPVMYMDMSVDGMLKGLDQQMSYMKYNIIDATSCVVLVSFPT